MLADSEMMPSVGPAQLDLTTCFPHRICINLARRPDRWALAQAQFQQHQIEVARWNAVDGATIQIPLDWGYLPGAYGCTTSHLEAVRQARARKYESLLIFEDDVELHPELRSLFPEFMAQVPGDWDAIYFGGIHRLEPAAAAPNVVRLVETNSTYAYALRRTVFDAFLSINERSHALTVKIHQVFFVQSIIANIFRTVCKEGSIRSNRRRDEWL